MLLYAKIEDGKNVIYSAEKLPADTDTKVVYKDADGDVLTLVDKDTYVDDGKGGIKRLSDDKAVNVVTADDEAIIPKDWTPVAKELVSISLNTKNVKTAYTVGEALDLTGLKITGKYASGDKEVIPLDDCTVSGVANPSALTKGTSTVTITVKDTTISAIFSITVTEASE